MEARPAATSEGLLNSSSCAWAFGWKLRSKAWAPISVNREGNVSKVSASFWQEDRRIASLALAAVVSASLAHPAMAMAKGSPYHCACSHNAVEDCATTSAEAQTLDFELRRLRWTQTSALSPTSNGSSESTVISETLSGEKAGSIISSAPVWLKQTASSSSSSSTSVDVSKRQRPLADEGTESDALSLSERANNQQIFPETGLARFLGRLLQHLGGGGLAGAVGATVVYPLDTIKTRLQAQTKDGKYANVLDCVKELLLEEGLGSLYNGLVPQLLGIAPEKALKLTVNEIMLGFLEDHLPGARVWTLEFIAGGGGGFSQVLVTNPMEIVKLRLQIQSKAFPPKGLLEMAQELGLRGLYNGSIITLARDVPGSAIFFACYALLLQMYPDQRFWAGFLAAIPSTLFVTPLDVIKTRLQMETPPGEEPYRDAFHCFRVLLQQEGLRGLFKGGLLRVARTSPQFGITLLMYSIFCDGH